MEMYLGSCDEQQRYWSLIGMKGPVNEKCSLAFVKKALMNVSRTASVFSVQPLQDWLSLADICKSDPWDLRINVPGKMNDKNWRLLMPLPLEDILKLRINKEIKAIHSETGRA